MNKSRARSCAASCAGSAAHRLRAALGALLIAGVLAGAVVWYPPPHQHAHDAPCIAEPSPPDLLDLQLTSVAPDQRQLTITGRPLDSGALEISVAAEGPARLVPATGAERFSSTRAGQTRSYRIQVSPQKAGMPAPAVIVDATLSENGVPLMQRSYRLPLGDEGPAAAQSAMPEPIPDGRGGTVRLFPGVAP